jgi:hypothetical protein
MGRGDVIRPFRWGVARRDELGSLPYLEPAGVYPEFEDDLIECGARVLAFAGDSDLLFIGRSPQPLFDLLSGLLSGTGWEDRLGLLDISVRSEQPTGEQLRAIYPYFAEVGLEPHSLGRRSRTLALVDVVDYGDTFESLMLILEGWSTRERADWPAAARKLRIVGMTSRQTTGPYAWRWQQQAEWVDRLRLHEIKNVAVPRRLVVYLATEAPKTSGSFRPSRWGDETVAMPVRDSEAHQALALAVHLFRLGRRRATRRRFAAMLGRQPAMAEAWFRSLVLEVKR